jgi:hypothetical protein
MIKSCTLPPLARKVIEMIMDMLKFDWKRARIGRAELARLACPLRLSPDLSEDVSQLVLKQAALSTENGSE